MFRTHHTLIGAPAALILLLPLAVASGRTAAAETDAVLSWNEHAGKAAIAACLSPEGNGLAEARLYAMVHAAVHDAVNAIARRSRPYAYDARPIGPASEAAAIATAARDVLVSVIAELQESAECRANGIASAEGDYAAALSDVADGDAKSAGVAVGRSAAEADPRASRLRWLPRPDARGLRIPAGREAG
jgi:hypothetical protein